MAGLRTVRRRISDPVVWQSALGILRETVLCSVATVGPGNRAHANTAYFAFSPRFEIVFLSDPGSRHAQNLAGNASTAITVFDSRQTWGGTDRGIQLFGTCREAKGPLARDSERLYARRFPEYGRILRGGTERDRRAARQLRTYRFYRFTPSLVKVFDERVFGGGVFVEAVVPPRRARPRERAGVPRRPRSA